MLRNVYAALVHFPIVDKHGHLVSTSVTNLDIHDISRSARTYGINAFFLVTPIEAQHWLVNRIIGHWQVGWGSTYNPNRMDALGICRTAGDLGEVQSAIEELDGQSPAWVITSAKRYSNSIGYENMRALMNTPGPPICLLFGTGWGLHPELILEADHILEPINGPTDFNHLSVRAAAAIIFDRLLAS